MILKHDKHKKMTKYIVFRSRVISDCFLSIWLKARPFGTLRKRIGCHFSPHSRVGLQRSSLFEAVERPVIYSILAMFFALYNICFHISLI